MNDDESAVTAGLTREAQRESSRGDVPGGETWPMVEAASMGTAPAPPVGLSWTSAARELNANVDVLRHDGTLILIGDTFPEDGYFVDPNSFRAQRVDVGQRALGRGYFLGRLVVGRFGIELRLDDGPNVVENATVRQDHAPLIALFSDRAAAERGQELVLRGSLGSGVTVEDGPLGAEVTVAVSDLPSRAATALASVGGAIISIGGRPVGASDAPARATGGVGGPGDAPRAGIGVNQDVPGPEKTSPPRLP